MRIHCRMRSSPMTVCLLRVTVFRPYRVDPRTGRVLLSRLVVRGVFIPLKLPYNSVATQQFW
jgi:hypothetical protein